MITLSTPAHRRPSRLSVAVARLVWWTRVMVGAVLRTGECAQCQSVHCAGGACPVTCDLVDLAPVTAHDVADLPPWAPSVISTSFHAAWDRTCNWCPGATPATRNLHTVHDQACDYHHLVHFTTAADPFGARADVCDCAQCETVGHTRLMLGLATAEGRRVVTLRKGPAYVVGAFGAHFPDAETAPRHGVRVLA